MGHNVGGDVLVKLFFLFFLILEILNIFYSYLIILVRVIILFVSCVWERMEEIKNRFECFFYL